ncbi:MAG: M56 family metallopeptidase [Pirellulales bacterium]
MTTLFEIGLLNAAVATLLAIGVWLATRIWRQPALVHVLWVVVLVKLVTPPIVAIPWHAPSTDSRPIPPQPVATDLGPTPDAASPIDMPHAAVPGQDGRAMYTPVDVTESVSGAPGAASTPLDIAAKDLPVAAASSSWPLLAAWVWLGSSILWLGMSTLRVSRFHRALRGTAPASDELCKWADDVAAKLGFNRPFCLRITEGRLAPLVWPVGRPTIVLARPLLEILSPTETRTLLAHELAHLRRKDHWVRWLELVVTAIYWWHPVTWWARRMIHQSEERACDAWAVWAFPEDARRYAAALFKAVQFATENRQPAPIVASRLGSDGNFKERIEHVMNATWNRELTRRAGVAIGITALVVLPLSLRAVKAANDAPEVQAKEVSTQPVERKDLGQAAPNGPAPADVRSDELIILREQIKFLADHARRVDALFQEGLEGGSRDVVETANYELSRAQAELALAEGNREKAIAALKRARTQAEDALKAVTARYEAGTVKQDALLQSSRNLVEAKQKLLQVQNMEPAGKSAASNTTLPPRINAPDDRIRPGTPLVIRALGVYADQPLEDLFIVQPDGTVALGPSYGRVTVHGLTINEAESAVKKYLTATFPDVKLQITTVPQAAAIEPRRVPIPAAPYRIAAGEVLHVKIIGPNPDVQIADDFVVEPSGALPLGPQFGRVPVAGLSLEGAEEAIRKHFAAAELPTKVQVTLGGWQRDGRAPNEPSLEIVNPQTVTGPAAANSATDSIRVLKTILDVKQSELARLQQLADEGAISTSQLRAKESEVAISAARLRQAESALASRKLLIALAEVDLEEALEANKKSPNSVSESQIRRLKIKVQLAEANYRELAE